ADAAAACRKFVVVLLKVHIGAYTPSLPPPQAVLSRIHERCVSFLNDCIAGLRCIKVEEKVDARSSSYFRRADGGHRDVDRDECGGAGRGRRAGGASGGGAGHPGGARGGDAVLQ